MDSSYCHSSSRSSTISEESESSGYSTLSDYSVPGHNKYVALTIDNVRRHKATLEETYNFVDNRGIQKSLRKIISDPDLCDVAFLVGEDRIPVYGLRSILVTRSRVFEDMILSEITTSANKKRGRSSIVSILKKKTSKYAEKCSLKIPLSGYDVNIFKDVIQFAHCGSVGINVKNVLGLLCGALEFEFEDLTGACWDFIGRNLSSMCSVYHMDQTMQYGRHKCIKDIQIAIIYHIQSHEDLHKQMAMLFPRKQKAFISSKASPRRTNLQSVTDAQPDNATSHACMHTKNNDISQERMEENMFKYMLTCDDNISTVHSNGLMAQKARQRRRRDISL